MLQTNISYISLKYVMLHKRPKKEVVHSDLCMLSWLTPLSLVISALLGESRDACTSTVTSSLLSYKIPESLALVGVMTPASANTTCSEKNMILNKECDT